MNYSVEDALPLLLSGTPKVEVKAADVTSLVLSPLWRKLLRNPEIAEGKKR